MHNLSDRTRSAAAEFAQVGAFFQALRARTAERPDACDFTFGNPHEMPLPGLVAALRDSIEPSARTGSPTRPARRSRARWWRRR
jgi:aspartate aminotransferase